MSSNEKKIYDSLIADFPMALQPISLLSKNTSANKCFVMSDELAFNFDLINNLCSSLSGHKEKSPDALFLHNDTLYFIEFKEGDYDKQDVRLKIHEAIITLYHFAINNNLIIKDDFLNIKIKYAVIIRHRNKGSPTLSFLNTLEATTNYFNLKNIEGLMIEATNVVFQPESILKLLRKISNGAVKQIGIMDKLQANIVPYS